MEHSQGHSFIPKSPVRGEVKPRGVRKVYVLTYLTFVFFFGTLLVTAGTFFFDLTVNKQLDTEKGRLAQERNSFNQANLERVRELEVRMNTSFNILDRQVSVHSVLEALNQTTLQSVELDTFEFVKDVDGALRLSVLVRTSDYNAALFQREVFKGNSILSGATIEKVEFTEEEVVDDEVVVVNSDVTYLITKKFTSADIPVIPPVMQENDIVLSSEDLESQESLLRLEDIDSETFPDEDSLQEDVLPEEEEVITDSN